MKQRSAGGLALIVTATGAAALILQVTWQRVIALRTGVDLISSTIAVSAFFAGLGLGNLVGGALADRVGQRRSSQWYAGLNAAIALAALISIPVLTQVIPTSGSTAAELLAVFGVVLIPTSLMGATFPLLMRAVVAHSDGAGVAIGRLTSVNTAGSAAGAIIGGCYVIGTWGITAAARLSGAIYLIAAVGAVALSRSVKESGTGDAKSGATPAPVGKPTAAVVGDSSEDSPTQCLWPWLVLFAMTGAVAIGLETVFFRVVDSTIRSNSYTFPVVLALYLTLYAIGAGIGSKLVQRLRPLRTWFLRLQLGVAVSSAASFVVMVRLLPSTPLWGPIRTWFNSDGIAGGFGSVSTSGILIVVVMIPLLLMGPPVILMGCALPFAQQLVSTDVESLGTRTGLLGAANLGGNVAGGLITSLVLLNRFGSAGAARLLVIGLLVAIGLAAFASRPRVQHLQERKKVALTAGGLAAIGLLVVAMPTNQQFWTFLHDAEVVELLVEEDRTCATTVKAFGDGSAQLHLNGASQNGYPFDDFHLLLGLLPPLLVDTPENALVIGLGIGSTTAGLLAESRVKAVTTVELCGGNERVIRRLGGPKRPELAAVLNDQRHTALTDDGRSVLNRSSAPFDVIISDTMRTTSASSGNTFSVEYYELIRSRLASQGVMATWIPTGRVLASVQKVFPYVISAQVPSYNDSRMVLASTSPIDLDLAKLNERFDAANLPKERLATMRTALSTLSSKCDPTLQPVTEQELNYDLHPRDEYFLNNAASGDPSRLRCSQ